MEENLKCINETCGPKIFSESAPAKQNFLGPYVLIKNGLYFMDALLGSNLL